MHVLRLLSAELTRTQARSEQGRQPSRYRDGSDEADRADESRDDLRGDRLGIDGVGKGRATQAEDQQHGQRRTRVGENERIHGRGYVIVAYGKGAGEKLPKAESRIRTPQCHNRRGLADSEVVEDAQRTNHHSSEEQALNRKLAGRRSQEDCLL